MSAKELTVTIKGAEQTYKQKFLIYDEISWNEEDAIINQCVREAISNTTMQKADIEKIKVRSTLDIE